MAYTSGDTILDDHYNGFATSVNALWGTGSTDSGYGESTTVAAVSAGATITAAQWTTLLARMNSLANHQNSSITAISNPSAGSTISAFTALSTNIGTLDTNRLNVHARQSLLSNAASTTTNLTGTITQTGNWSFGSENQARYFFNAGGRLSVSWSISGYTANLKANGWNTLLNSEVGTYYIYAQSSGKSGGSGSPATNNTNLGWHDLTGSYQTAFKQLNAAGSYAAYTSNYVQLDLYKSGGTIYWRTYMVDAAADQAFHSAADTAADNVDGTKKTTFGHERPSTTYVGSTYGAVTLTVTANG